MKMDKKLSASRGFRPADPKQGLCPWTPLGTPIPDPRYRLVIIMVPLANPGCAPVSLCV